MHKVKTRHIFLSLILIISGLFLLIPSFFAFPAADDYCYALMHDKFGFFMREEYLMTNGRWASTFFLQPAYFFVEHISAYRIMPLVWLILSTLAFYSFLKSFHIKLYSIKNIHTALLLSLLFFYLAPSLSNAMFWYTGAVNYILPVIIFLFSWSLMKYSIRNMKIYGIISAYALIFIASSFNEVALITVPFLSWWLFRKELKRHTIIMGLTFAFAAAIFYFSPGNLNRSSAFSVDFFSAQMYFSMGLQFLRFSFIFLFLNPLVWLILFIYFSKEKQREFIPRFLFPLFVLIPAIALPYFGTGILGQHRTINYAFFIFLILLLYQNRDLLKKTNISLRRIIPIIVLSLFISTNGIGIADDFFKFRFHTFKVIMNSSLNSLEAGNGPGISNNEEVPHSLMNQYPVEGWNEKNNFCGEVYFDEKQK